MEILSTFVSYTNMKNTWTLKFYLISGFVYFLRKTNFFEHIHCILIYLNEMVSHFPHFSQFFFCLCFPPERVNTVTFNLFLHCDHRQWIARHSLSRILCKSSMSVQSFNSSRMRTLRMHPLNESRLNSVPLGAVSVNVVEVFIWKLLIFRWGE